MSRTSLFEQAYQEITWLEEHFIRPDVVEVSQTAWEILSGQEEFTDGWFLWDYPVVVAPKAVYWPWLHVRGVWPRHSLLKFSPEV